MTTLRDILHGIFCVALVLVAVAFIVIGIDAIMPPREQQVSPTETDFRAACAAVKGNTAWNGRHWECLK